MSKKENMVVKATVSWWLGKRPAEWQHPKHMANPTVNCANEKEKQLAKSIHRYLDTAPNANQLLKDAGGL